MATTNALTNSTEAAKSDTNALTSSTSVPAAGETKLYKDTNVGSFVYLIVPVFLTLAIGGGLHGWLARRKDQKAKNIDAIVGRCEELRNLCIQYWSSSVNKNTAAAARVTEQKIKGAVKAIIAEVRSFSERHDKRAREALKDPLDQLNDACTGGDFETAKRQPDKSRCEMVGNEINRVNTELQKFKK